MLESEFIPIIRKLEGAGLKYKPKTLDYGVWAQELYKFPAEVLDKAVSKIITDPERKSFPSLPEVVAFCSEAYRGKKYTKDRDCPLCDKNGFVSVFGKEMLSDKYTIETVPVNFVVTCPCKRGVHTGNIRLYPVEIMRGQEGSLIRKHPETLMMYLYDKNGGYKSITLEVIEKYEWYVVLKKAGNSCRATACEFREIMGDGK